MSVSNALASTAFERQLAFGQIAETQIAMWVISRGNLVLPIYDVEIKTGKGPRLFGGDNKELVAPDLLVMSSGGVYWLEAKHKTVFSWYRKDRRWVTGIDIRHYLDYRKVAQQSPWEVWLLFLHRTETPWDSDIKHGCPEKCPVGLFGNTLAYLSDRESHRSDRHGRTGMVYWAADKLKRLATLDEINATTNN